MIPLKDNIPTRRFSVVVVTLIALNVLVFLVDRFTGRTVYIIQHTEIGDIIRGKEFIGGLTLQYSLVPAKFSSDPASAWITVFSSMFLHSNWLHIGGNMLSLWIFGNNVEDTLGRARFLAFYLICGVGAAMLQVYTNPTDTAPMVGASGAVAGLMGAYIILFPKAEILSIVPIFIVGMLMEVPAIIVIGVWILTQFANAWWLGGGELSHGGGVAYFAHIGGFVAGIVLILVLGGRALTYRRDDHRWDNYYR